MALDTPRNLFLHELGKIRDAERTGSQLLGWLSGTVRNPNLAQQLRGLEQQGSQLLANIDTCLAELGGAPLETISDIVDGIRVGFEQVTHLQPSPEVLDLFALTTALKFVHVSIGSYISLIHWADLTGQTDCRRCLQSNLAQKEASSNELAQVGYELGQQLLVASG